ncbi:hypothetical protein MKP07_02735 [Niabella hibiscisoli]|nr:DUF6850 family outer membrane beta-barrel protein [Niabella hibiscisoli]MCH5715177.1 hypothetical protein [Niabella hibiscisoli]
MGYRLIEGLYLGSLLNYNYHWSTGSVDPRPDNKLFQLTYTPGLFYKVGNTVLGGEYVIGKADGDFDIGFKNSMYARSQLYPERQLWLNTGYGYTAKYGKEAYSQSRDKIDGWKFSASTILYNWNVKVNYSNTFLARKNFNLLTNTDSINNPIKETIHSKYELVTQKLDALIFTDNSVRNHQVHFNAEINEGTAQLMSSPGGANYLFDEHNAQVQYLLSLKKKERVNIELGFEAQVSHFAKKDFLAMHFYENTKADFSVQGGKYLYGKNHSLKITAQPGLILPFTNSLQVPETQVNVFTKSIVYPEYDFLGSTFFTGKLGLMYYSPSMLRLAGSSISLNINYLQKLKDSDINRTLVPTYTGKNQLQISLGFQIFL